MQRSTFRTFCYIVGFLGIVFITVNRMGKLATWLGVILCLIFMVFGYVVTSPKWAKYLIGEPGTGTEAPNKGSMGG